MNKPLTILVIILVLILGVLGGGVLYGISINNDEVGLRNLIAAKQRDNVSELDNMQKKIEQAAQVAPAQMAALKEVIVGYAAARNGGGDHGGAFINAVHEAIPNVDQRTFANLQNIITGSRDAWTQRQKEILDLKRAHDDLRTMFPSSLICGSRPEIQVQIVTSSRVQADFVKGVDDSTKLFQ